MVLDEVLSRWLGVIPVQIYSLLVSWRTVAIDAILVLKNC